jgi:hypothetical protein
VQWGEDHCGQVVDGIWSRVRWLSMVNCQTFPLPFPSPSQDIPSNKYSSTLGRNVSGTSYLSTSRPILLLPHGSLALASMLRWKLNTKAWTTTERRRPQEGSFSRCTEFTRSRRRTLRVSCNPHWKTVLKRELEMLSPLWSRPFPKGETNRDRSSLPMNPMTDG